MDELFNINWEATKVVVFRKFEQYHYFHQILDFDIMPKLIGVESQMQALDANTQAFLRGENALNALLWGARGCGKSSVVKNVLGKYLFVSANDSSLGSFLRVIEIDSKDILFLPILFDKLREKVRYKFAIFCDDLSFRTNQNDYKSIKSVLEGSFESPAKNIIIYATSNIRRILEKAGEELSPQDSITQEELSLSDRFGLQLGFYDFGTDQYLQSVEFFLHSKPQGASLHIDSIRQEALNFATQIGNRSARSAKEFVDYFIAHKI